MVEITMNIHVPKSLLQYIIVQFHIMHIELLNLNTCFGFVFSEYGLLPTKVPQILCCISNCFYPGKLLLYRYLLTYNINLNCNSLKTNKGNFKRKITIHWNKKYFSRGKNAFQRINRISLKDFKN